MSRGRRFSFTLNNPQCSLNELYQPAVMSYLVAGQETAPSTGTIHYQGYVEIPSRKSLTTLSKELAALWKSHPHLSISKGSAAQNKVYCLKDQGPSVEEGSPMQPGARTDLSFVTELIANGSTMTDLWKTAPETMIKYSTGIQKAYSVLSPNMNQIIPTKYTLDDYPDYPTNLIMEALKTKSVILWGSSGSRKTSYARALLPDALFVSHMDDLIAFDPATHTGIIFDDMNFKHLPRESQIHIFDFDHPRSIHVRYQVARIPAYTLKIFTTNNVGGLIYEAQDRAIERRVKTFQIELHDQLPTGFEMFEVQDPFRFLE